MPDDRVIVRQMPNGVLAVTVEAWLGDMPVNTEYTLPQEAVPALREFFTQRGVAETA